MAPKSLTTVSSLFFLFSFRSNQFIFLKKMRGLCLMSLNWCRYNHVHVLFETNGVSFVLLFISVKYFCHKKWILERSVQWNLQIKIIKLSVVLKRWDEWCIKWILTQGARTPCFFRIWTTVFLSDLKTNFTLKCLQTSLTCISLCQKCCDRSMFIS